MEPLPAAGTGSCSTFRISRLRASGLTARGEQVDGPAEAGVLSRIHGAIRSSSFRRPDASQRPRAGTAAVRDRGRPCDATRRAGSLPRGDERLRRRSRCGRGAPARLLEVGCGLGQFSAAVASATGAERRGARPLAAHGRARARRAAVDARVADVQALPFADAEFDCVAAPGCSTTCPTSTRRWGSFGASSQPSGRLSPRPSARSTWRTSGELVGFERAAAGVLAPRTARSSSVAHFATVDATAMSTLASSSRTVTAVHRYVESTFSPTPCPGPCRASRPPLRVRRTGRPSSSPRP